MYKHLWMELWAFFCYQYDALGCFQNWGFSIDFDAFAGKMHAGETMKWAQTVKILGASIGVGENLSGTTYKTQSFSSKKPADSQKQLSVCPVCYLLDHWWCYEQLLWLTCTEYRFIVFSVSLLENRLIRKFWNCFRIARSPLISETDLFSYRRPWMAF